MDPEEHSKIDAEVIKKLKHDIRNQLSGMILCIEQLKFELKDAAPDQQYYMRSISEGCTTISKFLDDVQS